MTSLRIAVISDPHFHESSMGGKAYSHLPVGNDQQIVAESRGKRKNPHDDLLELISAEGLEADITICAGDITTYAQPIGLSAGWSHLQSAARSLGSSMLCAATGNHDVDSRPKDGDKVAANPTKAVATFKGAIENLKSLSPTYPVTYLSHANSEDLERDAKNQYWGEAFVMLDVPGRDSRVVVFNSCSEHDNQAMTYERGSTPGSTLVALKRAITRSPKRRLNILVGHHPLTSQSGDGDNDVLGFQIGGDQVLRELESLNDDWLVINGHRHSGELKCGPSHTGLDLTMLSAASFAGDMSDPIGAHANQFYLIELSRCLTDDSLRGSIRSWDWHFGSQWTPSKQSAKSGIYDRCGFGSRLKPLQIANLIKSSFDSGITLWEEILQQSPELNYVMPSAMRATVTLLQAEHNLVLECDHQGMFAEVTKSP